jgi:predicted anti-sigma-YlaC factor YlaD
MFCDEVLDAIEAIAAGDVTPDTRVAEHLTSCPNCAAALASARALEQMLRTRPVPRPPAQFTTRTLARVRRLRWRSEQLLDVGFNIAVSALALAIVGGAWMLLHRSGLAAVGGDAVNLFTSSLLAFARRISPSLPLYVAATGLLATALGVWWWAERDATY